MPSAIPIHVSNGKAYMWDVKDAEKIRTEYHITGSLVGTLPSLQQQNVFLGMPLLLSQEEVVYLMECGAAAIHDDKKGYHEPSEEQLEEWREGVKRERAEAQTAAELERQAKVKAHSKKATAEAEKKRVEREAKKAKKAKNVPLDAGPSAEGQDGTQAPHEGVFVPDDSQQDATPQDKEPNFSVTIPGTAVNHPWFQPPVYQTLEAAREAGVWTYPSTPLERAKCAIFKDLIDKGYFIGPGLKFGGDWLVYPGDQLRYHSHFVATVYLTKTTPITPMQIVALGRLGTATKKSHLLCGYEEDSGKIDYYTIAWGNFG